jgi:hypothetical protein
MRDWALRAVLILTLFFLTLFSLNIFAAACPDGRTNPSASGPRRMPYDRHHDDSSQGCVPRP